MNPITRVLGVILSLILSMALLPGSIEIVRAGLDQGFGTHQTIFGTACLAGVIAFSSRRLQFAHVFLHEASHIVASMLSGHSVRELYVSAAGNGHVMTNQSNILVSLAPYSMSLAPMLLLIVASFVRPEVALVFVGSAGFLFGDHLVSVVRDFRPYQPDIQRHGTLPSLCFVALFNVISVSLVMLLLSEAPVSSYTGFFASAVQRIVAGAKTVWALLS
jgi:hypothetical protein